ncbi:MAG: ABC transporter permease, partial [Candidatus Rokubacteria bacterium RIFCSPLOWO2_12_FULL_71_22]
MTVTPLSLGRARTSRRVLLDRISRRLVVLGGVVIIASILAILLVIAAEVYPVFRPATAALLGRQAPAAPGPAHAPAGPSAAGVDEYRAVAWRLTGAGSLEFVPLGAGQVPEPAIVPGLDGARVSAVAAAGRSHFVLGTSDGRLIPLELAFAVTREGGARVVTPEPAFGVPLTLDPEGRRAVRRLAAATPDGGPVAVAQVGPTALLVQTVVEKKVLIGPGRTDSSVQTLDVVTDGEITALALDGRGEDLFVGTSRGRLLQYDLRDRGSPKPGDAVDVSATAAPLTALGFLLGDRTLVVGDGSGAVTTWQLVAPPGGGERRLAQLHRFEGHPGPVIAIAASGRDKGFVTADAGGAVRLHYGTSGQTLLSVAAPDGAPLRAVVFAPKADGVLAADATGAITHWRVDNPHPEVTLGTLFGRVWYEGYAEPAYVWQSTGGTDDFEAKLSLAPLIFGTLKGTLYALLFAVPLALLAALYVSEFMHPVVKGWVKPAVEIMAALPSVVLGFLAGLWLAPMVERVVPGLFLMPLVTPGL